MKTFVTLSAVALSTLFLSTGCSNHMPHHDGKKEAHAHKAHWGYAGKEGPAYWGSLDKKFYMCAEGKQQTPINIMPTEDVELSALALSYPQGSKSVINNGHTVQVNIEAGNTFMIEGVPYELKQFHFHTPSENHIDGKSYPMEAHFVHASAEGKLAVIGVVFEEGDENPTLGKIIGTFPLETNQEKELVVAKEYVEVMMPSDKAYYQFMGSLTTPPCSEEVKWFVLKTPQTASAVQIEAMHQEIGTENNRPIQATNGRKIME